jgi:hypothetical protein
MRILVGAGGVRETWGISLAQIQAAITAADVD